MKAAIKIISKNINSKKMKREVDDNDSTSKASNYRGSIKAAKRHMARSMVSKDKDNNNKFVQAFRNKRKLNNSTGPLLGGSRDVSIIMQKGWHFQSIFLFCL